MATTRKSASTSKKASTRKSASKRSSKKTPKKWSANVTRHSNALDLDKGIFKSKSPNKIANSLEDSAEKSTRKKGSSYQSAMSMLNFYINRAGKNLPAKQKAILNEAKDKLKALHEKDSRRQK
jgi:hypothetical protein